MSYSLNVNLSIKIFRRTNCQSIFQNILSNLSINLKKEKKSYTSLKAKMLIKIFKLLRMKTADPETWQI